MAAANKERRSLIAKRMQQEEEEEAKKEEVRSNALSYTYRLRGWRRSEYRREAGKMLPKKNTKKMFLLMPKKQTYV